MNPPDTMTATRAPDGGAAPGWSRRPYVGALPKTFQTTLPASEASRRLALLADGPVTVGAAAGASASLRLRAGPPLPATTLRVMVTGDEAAARIQCRFDASRLDAADLWVYGGATVIGFVVSGSWLSGHMPLALRERLTAAAPAFMALLALTALAHYGFRRWRQAVRDRLFDHVVAALGVPIE